MNKGSEGTLILQGAVAYAVQELVTRIVGITFGIILMRLLSPDIFGVFAITSFIINFSEVLLGTGLGAALIRKQSEVSENEYRTVFTANLGLSILVIILVFGVSPWLVSAYNMDDSTIWLIRTLSVSHVISAFSIIPDIKMQRSLRFSMISIAGIIRQLVYYTTALVLAFLGWEIWSLVTAVLVSALAAVVTRNIVNPWRPSLGINIITLKEVTGFGANFQLNKFIWLFKDAVTPILVGLMLGSTSVGYLIWAQYFSSIASQFVHSVAKMLFPSYSRLLNNKQYLQVAVEKTIRYASLLIYPFTFLSMALAPQIVHYVFTDKWLPGLTAFYLFSLNLTGPAVFPTMDLLYAVGNLRRARWYLIAWTVVGWGLAIPFVAWFGIAGWPLANLVNAVFAWPSMKDIKAISNAKIGRNFIPPLISSAMTGLFIYLSAPFTVNGILSLAFWGITGLLLYTLLLTIIEKKSLSFQAILEVLGLKTILNNFGIRSS